MADNIKKWAKPQLIVLGRGTPEENVLANCKTTSVSGAGTNKNACKAASKGACSAANCSTVGSS